MEVVERSSLRVLSSSVLSTIMHMLVTYYVHIKKRHDTFSKGVPKHFRRSMFILYNDGDVVFCEVTGGRVNRGSGLGTEVSRVDKLKVYRPRSLYKNVFGGVTGWPQYILSR